jgi:hypothetical protein
VQFGALGKNITPVNAIPKDRYVDEHANTKRADPVRENMSVTVRSPASAGFSGNSNSASRRQRLPEAGGQTQLMLRGGTLV